MFFFVANDCKIREKLKELILRYGGMLVPEVEFFTYQLVDAEASPYFCDAFLVSMRWVLDCV